MNREIKDCIESLTGEFKRADQRKLKEWINLQIGHKNLVQAICLIEAKAMEDIINLTMDSQQDSAEQQDDAGKIRAILGTITNCIEITENVAMRIDLAVGYTQPGNLTQEELKTLFNRFHDGDRIFVPNTELSAFVMLLNARLSDQNYSINYKIHGNFTYLIRINQH